MDINKYILDAIDLVLDAKIKNLSFNSTIEGIITSKNNNSYNIEVKGKEITAESLSNHEYEVGDVVIILVINNNYSDKVIIGRR